MKKSKKLTKKEFERFLDIQSTILGIRNTIIELINCKKILKEKDCDDWLFLEEIKDTITDLSIYRGLWEKSYHKFWIQIRRKYKLSLFKNWNVNRLNGVIEEIADILPVIHHENKIIISTKEDLEDE